MDVRPRLYDHILQECFAGRRQMALISGPCEVGKNTSSRLVGTHYLNWDDAADRRLILRGPGAVAEHVRLEPLDGRLPLIVLAELHKHRKWREFLKGLFDVSGPRARVIVTGSSQLDVMPHCGDGLMGRYACFRMHPWSVGECARAAAGDAEVQPPQPIADADWSALLEHGGFPEPFLKRDPRFTRRWQALRQERLVRADLRDIAPLQDPGAMEMLALILSEYSSRQLIYSTLSREIGVAVDTARRWVDLLVRLHYGFLVRPWSMNIPKSLRKEPKWFLRDWSAIENPEARARTLVACHLLKAVEGWTDMGLGQFELRYLRDKSKREIDFLVVRDHRPWFLVEIGKDGQPMSDCLGYFQVQTRAQHAFQAVLERQFVNADCFERTDPVTVPARTLLSQLL
jgi:predicted AAA+ superfamily ATPase